MSCHEKTRLKAEEKLEFFGREDLEGLIEKKIEIDTKV
jgi:hypothetical protein